MNQTSKILCFLLVIVFSPGCALFQYDYETPSVNVSSFRPLSSEGLVPRFEIGLLVMNPNRTPLGLEGISYSLEIEGYKILKGVANKLPVIEGYGQGEVVLIAVPNLLRSVQLIAELMNKNKQKDSLHYAVDAKLDTGTWMPSIRTRDEGTFSFADSMQRERE